MDGIYFRLFSEITRHWNTTLTVRSPISNESWHPYQGTLADTKGGLFDTAICGVWITWENYREYDLTSTIDRHCITFLVPVQQLIKNGSTIYISLSGAVWALYVGTFVSTGIISIILARIYWTKLNSGKEVRAFAFLSDSYMDLVNIASSHGIRRFPKQNALKIIVMRYDNVLSIRIA